ncbi:MAG: hypothetical protein KKB62_00100 [Nanoarchaeota archaeon]|nr:hypothetical protein [Nanoarchaeota archaeon]
MKKEQSQYQKEYYGGTRSKKKYFIFLAVLLILGLVAIIIFLGDFNFTGNIVDSLGPNNTFEVKASLSVPEINLDGYYEEIIFSFGQSSLYVDNKRVPLEGLDNKIVLRSFNGFFSFKEGDILKLDGKASEITINSVPISSDEGTKIKVLMTPGANYKSIEIKERAYLKSLDYISSGQISLGENLLKINSERVVFKNYLGSLSVIEGNLVLNGIVESIRVEGDSRKVFFER